MIMQFENYKDIARYINETIPNETTISLLFGVTSLSARDVRGISSINKLLQTTFLLAYIKWLNKGRSIDSKQISAHSENVFRIFEYLYKIEPYSLDVLIYCLTEMKRDVMQLDKNSFFADILKREPVQYSKYYGLIYDWQHSLNHSESNQDVLFGYLSNLLKDINYLQDFELSTDASNNINLTFKQEKLNVYNVLTLDSMGYLYILRDRVAMCDEHRLTYVGMDDFKLMTKMFQIIM